MIWNQSQKLLLWKWF